MPDEISSCVMDIGVFPSEWSRRAGTQVKSSGRWSELPRLSHVGLGKYTRQIPKAIDLGFRDRSRLSTWYRLLICMLIYQLIRLLRLQTYTENKSVVMERMTKHMPTHVAIKHHYGGLALRNWKQYRNRQEYCVTLFGLWKLFPIFGAQAPIEFGSKSFLQGYFSTEPKTLKWLATHALSKNLGGGRGWLWWYFWSGEKKRKIFNTKVQEICLGSGSAHVISHLIRDWGLGLGLYPIRRSYQKGPEYPEVEQKA